MTTIRVLTCNKCGRQNPEGRDVCRACGYKAKRQTIKHETFSVEEIELSHDDAFMTCRTCGCTNTIDDWEVLGADEGHVFCPACYDEQPSDFHYPPFALKA